MGDPTKLRLAPAIVKYDSVDLGYTSFENAIEIDDTAKEVELKAAQEGDTAVDAVLTGHTCIVTVPSVEVDPTKLAMAIPNATLVGGLVTIVNRVGQSQRTLAKELQIVRIIAGVESTDPDDIFTFPLASPMAGPVKQSFNANRQEELTIRFRIWPDATTKEFYHVGA